MPLYEYVCDVCGEEVETLQRMGEEPPVCHEQKMRKKLSLFKTRKGAGLYSLDLGPTQMKDDE